ncbi:MAG: flagellar biosynthetic protein FliO [Candidatus Eisenbacteria bacterium]|nr:flagellar biosynthetic protein FliO [Candidatus Eisenbacteria bacterium]
MRALRLLWVAGMTAWATNAAALDLHYTEPSVPPAPSMLGLLLRTGLALAVVVALVYLVAWLLRRAQPGFARARKGPVEVESHVPLGPKRSLYTVRWGRFRLLLGAGSSEITLLASEWNEGAGEPAAARGELPDEAQFGKRLDDFLSRLGKMEDDRS